MKAQDYKISSEKFVFHSHGENLHDTKLETKPISYFRDAFNRFARNKASIFASIVIIMLILFAIIAPFCTPYEVAYEDSYYRFVLPKLDFFYDNNIPFWDGGKNMEVNKFGYDKYAAIEQELGRVVIMTEPEVIKDTYMGKPRELYSFRLDTYNAVGAVFKKLTLADYQAIQDYQDANNVQIILPITDPKLRPTSDDEAQNANIWFATKASGGNKTQIVYDSNGNLTNIYVSNDGTDKYTSKMYLEGDEKLYNYSVKKDGDLYEVRLDYLEYYKYIHALADDGITEPSFIFGTNNNGKDLFVCLSSGARFSFLLAIIVSVVNLSVGAIYGAIEGYYGGKIDIAMERFVEILGSIPSMIVISLLKYHLDASHITILFISFFATGWTGMAGRTRMQFYRFKNQEYVLVARTLGAKDKRIMFKHIFPNAIGTLITSSVLVIPSVIFSETSLSYLGIINLSTGNLTSVGTLLATGQNFLFTYPHMILFPAIFISLLMLCFNLFGNGLRDAFNPSLRGSEE